MSVVGVEYPYPYKKRPTTGRFFVCDVGEFPIC